MSLSKQILQELEAGQNPAKAAQMSRFFKTGKGEYAEGDVFWGLTSAQVQGCAKKHWKEASFDDMDALLRARHHEARSCAVFMLVLRFGAAKTEEEREAVFSFFVERLPFANNWDLIDISVHKIIGAYLFGREPDLLYKLAKSKNLWEQRAAVVSTMYFIKRGKLDATFTLCEGFLTHPHDLMHKACGWMLREAGKRDASALCAFLDKFAARMPRTMLRYALEKFPREQRAHYMAAK
ncbi:DNA alkylation repair protein [Candidatus Avelusimicrobium alvi]|uniref:DNA alkylation repair protein n=1 Tax=Candidatus Avelusimicrobium alvi TaxID=3416221 RepID=UPI003D09EA8C